MRVHVLVKCSLGVAVLGILAAVGAFFALQSINLDQVKENLATQVQTATGRTLTIAGPLKLQLLPVPLLVADTITLSNPPGSSRPEMIRLERFELEVALLPLFRREILVNRLVLTAPDVLVETETEGPGNLDFSRPATPASQVGEQIPKDSEASTPLRLIVNELTLTNGRFSWYDRTAKTTELITIPELKIHPDPTAPDLLHLQLVTTFRDRDFSVSGQIGSPFAPDRSKPWPINLTFTTQGLLAQIQGSIAEIATRRGLALSLTAHGPELMDMFRLAGPVYHELPKQLGPFRLQGQLKDSGPTLLLHDATLEAGNKQLVQVTSKGSVSDLTGAIAIDLATEISSEHPAAVAQLAGLTYSGKGPMQLAGRLQGSGATWKVDQLQGTVGDNHLAGDIEIHRGKRIKVIGTLTSTFLNPADFSEAPTTVATPADQSSPSTKGQETTARKSDGRFFSGEPLPFGLLRTLDANLTMRADRVMVGNQQVNDAAFTAALQNGRLQVNPLHLGLAGGTIDGETTVDVTAETPRVTLRLQGRQIEIGALDRNGPISGGKSDLKVLLSASGNSARELMASATGESSLSVGQGRLRNKTLDTAAGDLLAQVLGALNPFAKAEDSSQLVCAAARFVLRDGIATADNGLAMRTSQVDVMGSGTVNLRSERIDVAIKPRARGATGLSLTTPLAGLIKVEGTIAHPSVVIDTAGTLKTAASVGAGIVTGGLTTLGEVLFDKVTADDDPCSTALRAPQPAKTPTKTEPSPKKSGGLLRGLFGK